MAASDSDDDNLFDDDKERGESVLCKSARLSAANSALLYFSSWVQMYFGGGARNCTKVLSLASQARSRQAPGKGAGSSKTPLNTSRAEH